MTLKEAYSQGVEIRGWCVCVFGEDSRMVKHRFECQTFVSLFFSQIEHTGFRFRSECDLLQWARHMASCDRKFHTWLRSMVHEVADALRLGFVFREVLVSDDGDVNVFVELPTHANDYSLN